MGLYAVLPGQAALYRFIDDLPVESFSQEAR
jgi:hypothetical protein